MHPRFSQLLLECLSASCSASVSNRAQTGSKYHPLFTLHLALMVLDNPKRSNVAQQNHRNRRSTGIISAGEMV